MGWAQLTSITAYIDFARDFYTGADASPATISEFDQHDFVRQFSQEFRLASSGDRKLDYVGGLYLFNDNPSLPAMGPITAGTNSSLSNSDTR